MHSNECSKMAGACDCLCKHVCIGICRYVCLCSFSNFRHLLVDSSPPGEGQAGQQKERGRGGEGEKGRYAASSFDKKVCKWHTIKVLDYLINDRTCWHSWSIKRNNFFRCESHRQLFSHKKNCAQYNDGDRGIL